MRKVNYLTVGVLTAAMGASLLFTACGQNESEKNTKETTLAVETTVAETTQEDTTLADETTEAETTQEKAKMPAMKDLYSEIVAAAEIKDMYELGSDDINDYYGIDAPSLCDDYVLYQSEISPGIDTVALFNCKDASAAKKVQKGLNTLLDSLKDSTKDYAPEEYKKAENASVTKNGNFVYLVVCEKSDAANDVIGNYTK